MTDDAERLSLLAAPIYAVLMASAYGDSESERAWRERAREIALREARALWEEVVGGDRP